MDKRDYSDDLTRVGPTKPMGYLPLSTVVDCGHNPHELVDALQKKGQVAFLLSESDTSVGGGVLVCYHEPSLTAFLSIPNNKKILDDAGWPTTADTFARRVLKDTAPQKTLLFDLIADAFADYTNPLRLVGSGRAGSKTV